MSLRLFECVKLSHSVNRENTQMLEFVENLSAYDGLGTEGLIRNKILAQNGSIVPIHGV